MLMGGVVFSSTWNANFYPNGHNSNDDGVLNTNGDWADDSLNVEELNTNLDNGSKWVGAAEFSYDAIGSAQMYDVAINNLEPNSTYDHWGNVVDDQTLQSGVFNVALNNSSEWDTVNDSNIDTLTVNNGSQMKVAQSSSLLADSITLTNGSILNLSFYGAVGTDHLTINSNNTDQEFSVADTNYVAAVMSIRIGQLMWV